jgi:hypothetical protein
VTNIIERLRDYGGNPMLRTEFAMAMHDAADEIERLRLENEKLAAAMASDGADACGALVVAEAEIERLREALDIAQKMRPLPEYRDDPRLQEVIKEQRAEIERLRDSRSPFAVVLSKDTIEEFERLRRFSEWIIESYDTDEWPAQKDIVAGAREALGDQ